MLRAKIGSALACVEIDGEKDGLEKKGRDKRMEGKGRDERMEGRERESECLMGWRGREGERELNRGI